jgi:limonene-1,2-epoxide hydrolase
MTMTPEQIVRAYLGSFGKSVEQDQQAYLHYLDEKVQYFSGTTMIRGNQATVDFAKRGYDLLGLLSWYCEVTNLLTDGDEVVMVERQDYQLDGDMKVVVIVPIMGFFRVRNGKIVEWRDYWDVRALMAFGEKFRAAKGMPPMQYGDDLDAGARAVMEAIERSKKAPDDAPDDRSTSELQ